MPEKCQEARELLQELVHGYDDALNEAQWARYAGHIADEARELLQEEKSMTEGDD